MTIVRNDDGSLTVPIEPSRADHDPDDPEATSGGGEDEADATPATRTLRPGEGGYDEALAEWDAQQHPGDGPAVSTASGRDEAMAVVHQVAADPDGDVGSAVAGRDAEPVAEALRHVLVGGEPSVGAFASEVADAEGGEPLPAHEMTKVIGEVLREIDG
jgi:hypothetical protein